ncbi:phage holin family protein [Candidatus Berkelbacteria bacterium]|nr:phage holin family protein [Candidatus Berkelbacteria bacterium]
MYVLLRWLFNTLALLVIANVIPGFYFDSFYSALIAALILGFVNATLRWVLLLLTLPLNLVTLGFFTFVINALMILLVGTIVKGFTVVGFWPAFWAAILLWLISFVTNWLLESGEEHRHWR